MIVRKQLQAGTMFVRNDTSVAMFPDKDKDGLGDVAVGAPSYNSGQGRVVILSSMTSKVLGTIDGVHGSGSNFGAKVLWHGTHLAISEPGYGSGVVHLYDANYSFVRTLSSTDRSIAKLGQTLVVGPDLNGTKTFLVGAPQSSPGGLPGSGSVLEFTENGKTVLQIDGTQSNAFFGRSIASNDTHILVGAPGWSGGAASPVNNTGTARLFTSGGKLVWGIIGTKPEQNLGYAVAGGVDLDGVPGPEWLVGSPGTEAAFVVDSNGGVVLEMDSYMPSSPHRYGAYVAVPGDLNQDGWMDITVGVQESQYVSSGVYYGPIGGLSGAASIGLCVGSVCQ